MGHSRHCRCGPKLTFVRSYPKSDQKWCAATNDASAMNGHPDEIRPGSASGMPTNEKPRGIARGLVVPAAWMLKHLFSLLGDWPCSWCDLNPLQAGALDNLRHQS